MERVTQAQKFTSMFSTLTTVGDAHSVEFKDGSYLMVEPGPWGLVTHTPPGGIAEEFKKSLKHILPSDNGLTVWFKDNSKHEFSR